ncbi:MAG: TlpA family protein disulfide reductase [Verrucomicrobiae bacterium]|nr:TlpA family protein disulfide reductase [Verrucomicrobiae bacterium]
MNSPRTPTLLLALAMASALNAASVLRPGDIVTEITNLVDRATGQVVSPEQLQGKVLFLDFFAHWCPVCRAAAPQIQQGIGDRYSQQDGNAEGLPVLHIGVNLQADNNDANRNATTTFAQIYRIPLVVQDSSRRFQGLFGPTSGQPTFAIINGVTNSPSHRLWELIYARFSYQDSTATRPIEAFQTAIDSVQAPPPQLEAFRIRPDGHWEFSITGPGRAPVLLEWSEDLGGWQSTGMNFPTAEPAPYHLPAPTTTPGGYLRLRRLR